MRPDEVIQNERRAMETMSETSEGTAATSVSGKSGEELHDIAAVLGIGNPDDLHQDRFRVDRRKLEQMLIGESQRKTLLPRRARPRRSPETRAKRRITATI